jgi:hypothetical protein
MRERRGYAGEGPPFAPFLILSPHPLDLPISLLTPSPSQGKPERLNA